MLSCVTTSKLPVKWCLGAYQAGEWTVGVLPGPNEAPDYFTQEDIKTLYSSPYSVHYNS